MAGLVLGPMNRWASTDEATVWVETDAACEVAVSMRMSSGQRCS